MGRVLKRYKSRKYECRFRRPLRSNLFEHVTSLRRRVVIQAHMVLTYTLTPKAPRHSKIFTTQTPMTGTFR